ncbi:MAG: DUF4249 domain-containing protein [Reichenbachiella sp.]|uniref:DUF4249 domain-containing protein n=1 Tax=Reichenbachiella sp. TaxID=2184521 RepID=UPI003267D260
MRFTLSIFLSIQLVFFSCVENFSFESDDEEQALVVEGFITDISYNDAIFLPMDARNFEIRLKMSSPVINVQDQPVLYAEVKLYDDLGNCWDYTDLSTNLRPGVYALMNDDFSVQQDRMYQLQIVLGDGRQYESGFESVPAAIPAGEIITQQTVRPQLLEDETTIANVDGLSLRYKLDPSARAPEESHYVWDFTTTYGYLALSNQDNSSPVRKCWMTTVYDHSQITLVDNVQEELDYELLFFDVGHQWLPEGISLLISQYSVSKDFYQFYDDIQAQEQQSELFAPPPFNTSSNLYPVGHNSPVIGFFQVANQNVYRWIFSPEMLDFAIPYPEWMRAGCDALPPPECFDCTLATPPPRGYLVRDKPEWWID